MRPQRGKKAWRKSEIARSACATMRVSRMISIYRAQRSQQGCSLSLGMLRLAEPPTGRARLRSSLKSPRNPITPIETSRVSTLHPGLYTRIRECARRVIGATAKPLYAIDGKAAGLDRRNPRPPSSREGDRRSGGRSSFPADGGRSSLLHLPQMPAFIEPPPHFFGGFVPFRHTCAGRPGCGYPPPPRCLRDSGHSRSSRRFAGACRRSRRVGSAFRR